MRDDSERRLAARLDAYESQVPDAEPPSLESLRRGPPLPALIGGGALAAVAAGLLAVVLLQPRPVAVGDASPSPAASSVPSASSSPSRPSTPSISPSTPQVPTPTPQPSGPATIAWSEGEEHEGWVTAVVRRGERWIAGGALQIGDFNRAAIWTSLDGQTWSGPIALPPEPVPDSSGMNPRYWVNGFGEWDGALLAFGWNGVGCCDGGYPMMWRSDDGDTWSVVDAAGSAYGDSYHSPQRSVATPQGQLAVLSTTGLGSGASIFLTGDLATWEEHPLTDPESLSTMALSGIAASPSLLMIVGTEQHPYEAGEDPPTTAHAWTSDDGRTWTSLATPNPNGTFERVTWDRSRERFVAVGTDDDGAPAAWLTADGSGWSWIPLAEEVGRMHDVVAVDGLIVASGSIGPLFGATGETIAWSSHDGVTWRVMPLVNGQVRSLVGATPGSAVMIVNRWDEVDGDSWQAWAGPAGE